ncbi:MAG: hypothetical protein ACRDMV_11735 [Streptosporangiales bacterium]
MAQVSSPVRTAAAVLLFAVAGVLLPVHALADAGPAGPASTAMHGGGKLVKATTIVPVRVAVDKTPAPAGPLPTAIVLGAVLVAIATGAVTVRGRRRVCLAAAPSRAPPRTA